jgi:hypothetical protein
MKKIKKIGAIALLATSFIVTTPAESHAKMFGWTKKDGKCVKKFFWITVSSDDSGMSCACQ